MDDYDSITRKTFDFINNIESRVLRIEAYEDYEMLRQEFRKVRPCRAYLNNQYFECMMERAINLHTFIIDKYKVRL